MRISRRQFEIIFRSLLGALEYSRTKPTPFAIGVRTLLRVNVAAPTMQLDQLKVFSVEIPKLFDCKEKLEQELVQLRAQKEEIESGLSAKQSRMSEIETQLEPFQGLIRTASKRKRVGGLGVKSKRR